MILQRAVRGQWIARMCIVVSMLSMLLLSSCQFPPSAQPVQIQAASVAGTEAEAAHAQSNTHHAAETGDSHRVEMATESPIALDPSRGEAIGSVFEAFLSPHQEGGEEEDTPAIAPGVFKSTAPSVPRNERQSRGHGVIAFTNDLSKAFVYVAIDGVKIEDIVMFHLHCGRPGQLGPIIVDFSLMGDLQAYWADNMLALEVTNDDLIATANHGEGLVGAFTAGCPIVVANPLDKATTISGMETIARQGELYFNLHTKGQTFFGDIRGKLQEVKQ